MPESRDVDVVVVGAGAAGLSATLAALPTRSVAVLVKGALPDGATRWAQGGIAAAVARGDSVGSHLADTLTAGAGLCDPEAVRELVALAPGVVTTLRGRGTRFDQDADGALALGREGGHGQHRIVHAGGDRTGAEISRSLREAVAAQPVDVVEHATVTDLLLDEADQAAGVDYLDGHGERRRITARAVVLATGGLGQLYATTSNPVEATGDGLALALRVGATVADAEFVQFHPTVLWTGPDRSGQQPLVTEALRGAGAVLLDVTGHPVMAGVHPLADLAPRDVVAAQLHAAIADGGRGHAYLDATGLGHARLEREFPTVLAACRRAGVDPASEPIPVAPGAHYHCGGVRATVAGVTGVPGLLAVGELARTGMHGANRLASNSLLEAVATGEQAGRLLAHRLPAPAGGPAPTSPVRPVPASERPGLQRMMSEGAGILRDEAGLARLVEDLDRLSAPPTPGTPAPAAADVEVSHMRLAASLVARGALLRRESRGSHRRTDHPSPDPRWQRPVLTRLRDGELHHDIAPEERTA